MSEVRKIGYSKKEASKAISLSIRSIDHLIAIGALKAMKVGRRVIISAQSLEDYIKKGTLNSSSTREKGGVYV